jgi:hypothetical protein
MLDYFYQKPATSEITKQCSEESTTNAAESHDSNSSTSSSVAVGVGSIKSKASRVRKARTFTSSTSQAASSKDPSSSSLDGESDKSTALTAAAMAIGISSSSSSSATSQDSEASVHGNIVPSIGLSTSIDLTQSYTIMGAEGMHRRFAELYYLTARSLQLLPVIDHDRNLLPAKKAIRKSGASERDWRRSINRILILGKKMDWRYLWCR